MLYVLANPCLLRQQRVGAVPVVGRRHLPITTDARFVEIIELPQRLRLIGLAAAFDRFQRLRNLTIEMLACYRARDWNGALAAIERGRRTDEANSLELLYRLYEVRIRDYIESPPPEDWNGAFALLTK